MNKKKVDWIERLFAQHRSSLQAFFQRRIRLRCDAPDLAQEVYLRMLQVKNISAIRNLELYLYTVANNLIKEHAVVERRLGACGDIEAEALQDQLAELPQFDSELDTTERTRRLLEVLEHLSPKCRAVVILQYRDGLSYQQIAERLHISTHMVKKYVTQALALCRRRMERLQ
jgi:RNA polymerase sigma-70 factor (ECF subfamily)